MQLGRVSFAFFKAGNLHLSDDAADCRRCHTQVKEEVQDKILIIKSSSITSYIHIVIHKVVRESLLCQDSAGEAEAALGWHHLTGGCEGGAASGLGDRYGLCRGSAASQLGTERSPCSSAVSRILQMTGDSTLDGRD